MSRPEYGIRRVTALQCGIFGLDFTRFDVTLPVEEEPSEGSRMRAASGPWVALGACEQRAGSRPTSESLAGARFECLANQNVHALA